MADPFPDEPIDMMSEEWMDWFERTWSIWKRSPVVPPVLEQNAGEEAAKEPNA